MGQALSTTKKCEPPPERIIGDFWSRQFAEMMNHWYGVHKFDKAPSPIITLPNGKVIILADVLLLERAGENYYCEVKHKSPTKYQTYGLEEYRFNSLWRLQEYVKARVLYVIHDHSLNSGVDNRYNNIDHWRIAEISLLKRSSYQCFRGDSLINGELKHNVPIYYWAITLWVPLQEYFFLFNRGRASEG